MIGRRIWVNLAVFAGLFALLTYWAVTNVITIDQIERPYRVTAYFANSPGLRGGFEVAYLGLRVGTIGTVELIDDPQYCGAPGEANQATADADSFGAQASTGACVAVELKIDRGTDLPGNVVPFVRRKSAVGEPYVDLVVPETGGVGQLAGGDNLVDGRLPLAYSDLFRALDDLVQAIPEDSFGIFFHELAIALDGRSNDIRELVQSTYDLTGTLASDPELLDSLATELTALVHTLAENRENIGGAIDNVALFADSLADNRARFERFLEVTPGFVDDLNALLVASGGNLTCALRSLATVSDTLAAPDTLAQVSALLDVAAPAGDALVGSLRQEADGTWVNAGFQFNIANQTPVVPYEQPLVLPTPPALRSCGVTLPAGTGAGPAASVSTGGTATPEAGGTPAELLPIPEVTVPPALASTDRPASGGKTIGSFLPVGIGVLLAGVDGPAGVGRQDHRHLPPLRDRVPPGRRPARRAAPVALVRRAGPDHRRRRHRRRGRGPAPQGALPGRGLHDGRGAGRPRCRDPRPDRGCSPSMTDVDEEQPDATEPAAATAAPKTVSPLLFVVGGLAVIALVVVVAFLARDGGTSSGGRTPEQVEVATAAGAMAEALLTYDFNDPDASLERIEPYLGGDFKEVYRELFEQVQTPLIVELQAVSTATVKDIFIAEITEDSARAIVQLDSTTRTLSGTRNLEDVYLILELFRRDGAWLVEDTPTRLAGTETVAPLPGAGDETPAEGTDATTTTTP